MRQKNDKAIDLRIRDFFASEAESMFKAYKNFETLLPSKVRKGSQHTAEEGRFVESILRNFLIKHLPSNIGVFSGFILKKHAENDKFEASTQIDIIIYDTGNFPIYEKFQEFVIVPPEGVLGIISVKKTLRLADLKSECPKILKNLYLCSSSTIRNPMTALFGFKNEGIIIEKNLDLISTLLLEENKCFDDSIYYVTCLKDFTIYKETPLHENYKEMVKVEHTVVNYNNHQKNYDLALQSLINSILSVYYERNNKKSQRPYFNQIELNS